MVRAAYTWYTWSVCVYQGTDLSEVVDVGLCRECIIYTTYYLGWLICPSLNKYLDLTPLILNTDNYYDRWGETMNDPTHTKCVPYYEASNHKHKIPCAITWDITPNR